MVCRRVHPAPAPANSCCSYMFRWRQCWLEFSRVHLAPANSCCSSMGLYSFEFHSSLLIRESFNMTFWDGCMRCYQQWGLQSWMHFLDTTSGLIVIVVMELDKHSHSYLHWPFLWQASSSLAKVSILVLDVWYFSSCVTISGADFSSIADHCQGTVSLARQRRRDIFGFIPFFNSQILHSIGK